MVTAIIIFLIITAISSFIFAVRKEKKLQAEIIWRHTLIDRYDSRERKLRAQMLKLENILFHELMKYENAPSPTRISKDTIEAVFYAMKKAHPDNGGKEEDFIRFKKCYEELTRK